MNTSSLPKNYELSTLRRTGEHYIPRRSHGPVEIERRRAQGGKGVLILEQQQRGIEVASNWLSSIEDPNQRARLAKIMGGAMLFSAGYVFDGDSRLRMRHITKLPLVAEHDGWRETTEGYDAKSYASLETAALATEELLVARRNEFVLPRHFMDAARAVGNAGLRLALLSPRSCSENDRPKDLQLMVLESARDMHNAAIELGEKLGTPPSIAQLADRLSPLSVELQRTEPDELIGGYHAAYELDA